MNSLFIRLIMVPAVTLCASVAIAAAEGDPNQVSDDGLQLVKKDRNGEIYANPDVDWSIYTEISLEDAAVSFRRNWQRDQNRYDPFKVKAADMERIKSSLSQQFREIFTEELTKDNGYIMSDVSGPNVLTIKPAIVNLDINAPDTNRPYNSKSYTDYAGEMTLQLELYDSLTGELLATASDRRRSPYRGYYQWTTSVSNKMDADRMLRQWAETLRKKLDEAWTKTAAADAAAD